MLCMRCCIRTNVDDDFLKERWELSFSPSRCLSNIKLPALALLLSFYANAHPTAARYYWKLIFSFSLTMRELCRSSCCIKTSEDDDDALICSTSSTFVPVRLPEWICYVCICVATAGWVLMYKLRKVSLYNRYTFSWFFLKAKSQCRHSRLNTKMIDCHFK